jgi:hypothetical protein
MEGKMNLSNWSVFDNFFNFLFGLPPIILIPLLVVVGFLIIRGVIKIVFDQAKSAAGAIILLVMVTFVLLGGVFILSKMPNILRGLENIFSPIFHF